MSAARDPDKLAARAGSVPAPKLSVQRAELRCGAVLLVSVRTGAPITSVMVHLRGGHALDPAGREGTAFLTGNLVDQGTEQHTDEELAQRLEPAGGTIHGDATGLSGSVASGNWKVLLSTLSEMVTSPAYPRGKIARQKKRLLDRLSIEREEPRVQAGRNFRRLVYGDHWLGRSVHGEHDSVERIQRRHLVDFHKRNWVASRAVIGVCGDVDPEAVRRFLDRSLAGWERGATPRVRQPGFPPIGPRTRAFPAQRQQVHLYLGHLGVRRLDPDYPALVLMDHVLGTGPGFTNRISRVLRDEQGLAYAVSANIHASAGILPGTFTAYIGTAPEHVDHAVRVFLAEMNRIREELVSPEELETARSYLIGSFAMGFERAARRVAYMVSAERYQLPPDHLEQLPRRFAAVTAEDVLRASKKHLHPEGACLSAAGPVAQGDLERLVAP